MGLNDWKKIDEWTIRGTWAVRYWNGKTAKTMQISKYREADGFEKKMGYKYDWHGKWYVNVWSPEEIKLFKTKSQALKYAKQYMKKH